MIFLLFTFLSNKIWSITCDDSLALTRKGPYEITDETLTYYSYKFNFNASVPSFGSCNSSCTFQRVYNNATCTCFGSNDKEKTKCTTITDPNLGDGVQFNFTSPTTVGYFALVYVYPGNKTMYTINNPNSVPTIVMFYEDGPPQPDGPLCADASCCSSLEEVACRVSGSCIWQHRECVYDDCFEWDANDPRGCPHDCVAVSFHVYGMFSNGSLYYHEAPYCVDGAVNTDPNVCIGLTGVDCGYVTGCKAVAVEMGGVEEEVCVLEGILGPEEISQAGDDSFDGYT